MEATMTLFRILTTVFVLAGLTACVSYSERYAPDHRAGYALTPDSPFPRN